MEPATIVSVALQLRDEGGDASLLLGVVEVDAEADAGVNVEMISTSEIRISVVTRTQDAEKAVKAVHTAFGLNADGEAVVYGGTGR